MLLRREREKNNERMTNFEGMRRISKMCREEGCVESALRNGAKIKMGLKGIRR